MKVAIRADSSVFIGSGHLMRCLTLAHALKKQGATVSFICRRLPGSLIEMVESAGYAVHSLLLPASVRDIKPDESRTDYLGVPWQVDAHEVVGMLGQLPRQDWLITDNYDIDARWESLVRPYVGRIMAVDDQANRRHDCDLLLDQNLYRSMESRYANLVPDQCLQLLGPEFALLRDEFIHLRSALQERDGKIHRLLVFYGGSDPSGETVKALEAIRLVNKADLAVDVVVGASNPWKDHIRELCRQLPLTTFHCQIDYISKLMAGADLALGASGTATWERCCLGLPVIVTVLAENQLELSEYLAEKGMLVNLGWYNSNTPEDIAAAMSSLMGNRVLLQRMGELSACLVDGNGAGRVASHMITYGAE